MQKPINSRTFSRVADDLKRPFLPNARPRLQPLPEAEMIARYGMRRLTAEEKSVFPGLRLVIQAKKVCITQGPAVLPRTKGWIVWIAETYPGSYLVQFPGAGPVLAPYHMMRWTEVSQDTPATTLASAKELERHQRWRRAFRRNIGQQLVVCRR